MASEPTSPTAYNLKTPHSILNTSGKKSIGKKITWG